jgi:hypothetical protein
MHVFELDLPFCANPECELHVRAGDPSVRGFGNWAQLADGRIIGRSGYGGVFLCDACMRAEAARIDPGSDRLTAA